MSQQLHSWVFMWKTENTNSIRYMYSMFTIVVVQLLRHVRLLRPKGLQNTRLCCPSPPRRVCPNSSLLSRWYHPIVWPSVAAFSSCLQSFLASGSFAMSRLFKKWPKYWSFSLSISPSNEYSGLIPFSIDWFDLLAVQKNFKRLLQYHSSKTSILHSSIIYNC